jgi:hypothetical protein
MTEQHESEMEREGLFLNEKEIGELESVALRVFGLHPGSLLVSIVKREVEIPDPFRDGARGRKPAQVITFAESDSPDPERALLEVVVADASFLGISAVHRMPYATNLVRYAECLDETGKLRRVTIDGNLTVLEFRAPLSGWEVARLVRALALGWTVEDIVYDEENSTWIAARYGYLQ